MDSLLPLCSGKRKRGESSAKRRSEDELSPPSSPAGLNNNSNNRNNSGALDYLTDELLIEILRRLPNVKSAVAFKLVSKRWCSLITTPYFVSQFLANHINLMSKKKDFYSTISKFITHSALLISPSPSDRHPQQEELNCKLHFITGKQDPIFESPGYTLEFLREETEFVSVVASCHDLLLCMATKNSATDYNYYICNPFTRQWILLPPAPITSYRLHCFGLVYEPNYQQWVQGTIEYRFKAVCIARIESKLFSMHIFCSETRQWNESLLLGKMYSVCGNIVAHDGKLYWHNTRYVVAYDPFNNETVLINDQESCDDDIRNYIFPRVCLGTCNGFLRVMKFVDYYDGAEFRICCFTVSELNTETGRLNLKHKIAASQDNFLITRPLAFHPKEKDVVYMGYGKYIMTCKIGSGELEVVGFTEYQYYTSYVFTTVLSWWPTPV